MQEYNETIKIELQDVLEKIKSCEEINIAGALRILDKYIFNRPEFYGEIYDQLVLFKKREIESMGTASCSNKFGVIMRLEGILNE